jgi:hypothetical protein
MFLIAQMLGEFLTERPLQHGLSDLRKHLIRAKQLRALSLHPTQHLIGELLVDQLRIAVRPVRPAGTTSVSVIA